VISPLWVAVAPADHIVFHVVDRRAVLFGRQVGQHVADVRGIKRRGLRRHARREVGIAHDGHAVVGDDLFVHDRQLAVATFFGGKVHDHRSRLHRLDHVLGPKLWGFAVGDQGRGDDDVDLGGQLAELGKLGFAEFGAGGLGVAAAFGPVRLLFLEVEVDEFRPHRLHLFGDLGAHVEGIGDRTQRGRGADGGKPRDTGPDDQHLGGRHLACGGDLPSEEAAKVAARLDHGAVARDIGHGRQRIHLLRAGNTRHHVHRDDSGALGVGGLHQGFVLARVEHGNQCLPLGQALDLGVRGRTHLDDDFAGLEQCGAGLDDLDSGVLVGGVGKARCLACAAFDDAVISQLLQVFGRGRGHGDPVLTVECLFWCADLHGQAPVTSPRSDSNRVIVRKIVSQADGWAFRFFARNEVTPSHIQRLTRVLYSAKDGPKALASRASSGRMNLRVMIHMKSGTRTKANGVSRHSA